MLKQSKSLPTQLRLLPQDQVKAKTTFQFKWTEKDISSPRVSEEINSDSCIISGDFTPETAQDLANKIKSGQLPFDMKVISQETVGAELGCKCTSYKPFGCCNRYHPYNDLLWLLCTEFLVLSQIFHC